MLRVRHRVAHAPIGAAPPSPLWGTMPPINIGLTFAGPPRSPESWSGIPAALTSALESMGLSVAAIDARMPLGSDRLVQGALGLPILMHPTGPLTFREARAIASVSTGIAVARTLSLLLRAPSLARLDGIVQLGSAYWLPSRATPYVTYEDMTVQQAVRTGYSRLSLLPEASLRRRVEFQRHMYRRARGCCFTSGWAAASAIQDYGIDRRKVHVVGVGANHLVVTNGREWYPPRFLFIGQDWHRKGGDAVVRAFKRVQREHAGAQLDLVGAAPPIVADGITVHGVLALGDPRARQRLGCLLRRATCFVMPSRHEPSALAYVEAARAGLPSIVSKAGGSEELVGRGGIGVEPNDDAALLAAMLVLSDPAVACHMGATARVHAERFTWEAVGARLVRALDPAYAVRRGLAHFL